LVAVAATGVESGVPAARAAGRVLDGQLTHLTAERRTLEQTLGPAHPAIRELKTVETVVRRLLRTARSSPFDVSSCRDEMLEAATGARAAMDTALFIASSHASDLRS
jgi:hypothetical protein